MSDLGELCSKKTMRNVSCCLKVHRYLTTFFRLKIVLIKLNCKMKVLKTSRVVYVFEVLWIIKNKIYVSTR